MHSQISCPSCGTPFMAEVTQIIDAGQNPQLKQQLLAGQLNVAQCPQCGAGGMLTTAMLFHDPAYDMFIIYIPQEMVMGHDEREKFIGDLTQRAMNAIPNDQRRAYMLQPQMIMTFETFIEKVLETEGVTKEMIERQRKQAELLQTLAKADMDVAKHLVKERMGEIDQVFFEMLQQTIDAVANSGDAEQLVRLTNVRAMLMTATPAGREVEKRQIAMHGFNIDAKKAGGLSPELLFKHVLLNIDDGATVDQLVQIGQQALTYDFFQLLSDEIEKAKDDEAATAKLTNLREHLLLFFDAMQAQTQQLMAQADAMIQAILDAPDKAAAIAQLTPQIDDAFMYVLSNKTALADQKGNTEEANALRGVYELIRAQAESQYPPEVLLINNLMEATTEAEQEQVFEANAGLLTPELITVIEKLAADIDEKGQVETAVKLRDINKKIEARLG